jgi:hypothetical protein
LPMLCCDDEAMASILWHADPSLTEEDVKLALKAHNAIVIAGITCQIETMEEARHAIGVLLERTLISYMDEILENAKANNQSEGKRMELVN